MKKIVAIFLLLGLTMSFSFAEGDNDIDDKSEEINSVEPIEIRPVRTTFNTTWMREVREPLTKEMLEKKTRLLKKESKEKIDIMKEDAKLKRKNIKEMSKEKIKEFRSNVKELRSNRNETLKANKKEAKENIKIFREENKWEFRKVLSEMEDDTKDSLRELEIQFKKEAQIIKDTIKDNFNDDELRKSLLDELQELRKAFYEDSKELLWSSEDALWLLEERKDVFLENDNLRKENAKARMEYRWEISDLVSEQKLELLNKIKHNLDDADNAKLERLLSLLEKISIKFENAKISDDKKDEVQSKIIALKEIIEEKLDSNISMETELDFESLLDFE